MAISHRLLIIDSNRTQRSRLEAMLSADTYECVEVTTSKEGVKRAVEEDFAAVITEYQLEDSSGINVISFLRTKRPRLPVIMVTSKGSSATAINAIKAGAFDYLDYPLNEADFRTTLDKALQSAKLMSKPVEIGQVYEDQDTIIGKSRGMTEIYKELARVAAKTVPVLIRGETGTGKELIARAIYQHGHRAHQPFIAVNCAAIPENLLESELFGHVKGAFTGAHQDRIGRFEQAHNGTIFLDEIGDMDLQLQSKLLRVLQEKTIQLVGDNRDIPVDVRVIAATHCDLTSKIDDGSFRLDLFYRLNVVTLTVPPLRERRSDIPLLAEYFLSRYAKEYELSDISIEPEAIQFLEQQQWAGNVRELENVIRKALLNGGFVISLEDIHSIVETSLTATRTASTDLSALVRETLDLAESGDISAAMPILQETLERELYAEAIVRTRGNQAQAARLVGVSRLTMREKLHLYDLHPSQNK